MSRPDVIELAKQGNPRAIAAIVSHLIKPYGITAKASRHDSCLHVLLESAQKINQPTAVALIHKLITSLNSEAIHVIRIYGRQIGEKSVAWSQEVELKDAGDPGSPQSSEVWHPGVELENADEPEPVESSEQDAVMESDREDADEPETVESSEQDAVVESDRSQEIFQTDAAVSERSNMAQSDPLPVSLDHSDKADLPVITASHPDVAALVPPEDMTQADLEQTETVELLQRPESFILIAFAVMLLLWEAYISFLDEADAAAAQPTTGKGFGPKASNPSPNKPLA